MKALNKTISATGATGVTEEDSSSTIGKDGEQESLILEGGEIVEDKEKKTVVAV